MRERPRLLGVLNAGHDIDGDVSGVDKEGRSNNYKKSSLLVESGWVVSS